MKKRLSKIFSCLLMTVLASFLAVTGVYAEEPAKSADYEKLFSYSGDVQPYTVPVSGYYKLEVWGASGGNHGMLGANLISGRVEGWVYADGGYGGYSVGYTYLKAGQILFVCVGAKGADYSSGVRTSTAYNGGGYGWGASGGGGATHIALGTNRGTLANYINNKSEILIVAGGGGGGKWASGEAIPGDDSVDVPYAGGYGGGVTGGTGDWTYKFDYGPGAGGTQTGPGQAPQQVNGGIGSFGKGGDAGPRASGGGGGWYGGGGGQEDGAGGGGSGYIGGCLSTLSYNGDTYTSSTARSNNTGNGKALITYLGPIYHRQKVQVCYENGDGTFTEYEDVVNDDFAQDSAFTWTREADETYREAYVNYTVTEEKTTQVTVYRQQYTLTIEKGNGIDSVTGEGEYRAGQTVTIEAKVKEGYEFNSWSDSETLTGAESTFEFEMPTNDLHCVAVAVLIEQNAEEEDEPGDSTENGSEDNTENDSEEEASVLPLPTPAPARTRIIAPADNRAQAEDEEVQIEVEESALAPVPVLLPSVDPALRSSILKGGSIHIPLAHIDTSGTDRKGYDYSFWTMAAVIICVIGIGGLILSIYYLFFRKYKIYDSRTDELIGISFIRKDERDMFWAKISDAVCEKAGSKMYLVIGENFVRSNPEKPLKVSARGKEFYRQIRGKVDIEFAQK